jgi:hypothetical protein
MKHSKLHSWLTLCAMSSLALPSMPLLAQNLPEEQQSVRIRFLDSATGYAVQPDLVEATPRAANHAAQRLRGGQIERTGRASLALEQGRHTLTVTASAHKPMSGEFAVLPNQAYKLEFHLDPLIEPREVQPDFLATLHRAEETVFVGFVVEEASGMPLENVFVRAEPSGRETRTDARGYFQIHVPVQTLAEAMASPAALLFDKPGYRAEERQYLELWSEGDWIYRIRLERGGGRNILDERRLRRRTHYPLHVRGEQTSGRSDGGAPDEVPVLTEPPVAAGPTPQGDSSPPPVRIPTNIRVLRSDGVTIDYVSLQTYCQRSLPSEWIASWGSTGPGNSGTNSLLAGAVAVRTYAIGFVNNPFTSTYDICGTTSCQVYNPTASDSRTTAAVNHTANYVMNQPGAARIAFKLTEYSAENNSLGFSCGDGYTQPTGGCIYDPVCTGEARFGHGRGICQWGTARWASGRRMQNRTTSDAVTNGYPLRDWIWLCEHYYPHLELVQGAPLMINDYVRVLGTSSLTVRQCADDGITSGMGCPQITTKASGATGVIIGGPVRVTSDGIGYTWWRVQWHDAGQTIGWSPENWLERTTEPITVPPVLAPIADMMVNEGSLLTFTNNATAAADTDIVITDFETFADGTANGSVLIRQPSFSGSTSGFLDPSPNTTSVTGTFPEGNGSARVLRANWSWNTTVNAWLRLTTSAAANLPNPVIDLTRKLAFDIYTDKDLKVAIGARETGNPAGTPIGSNGGATGGIEFVGVTNVGASSQPQATRTVSAGSWTTLVFDLPNEPVRNFASGNGVLSSATGLGVLEHLAFVPAAGSGAYNAYLDNFIVSTPNVLTYSLSYAPPGATINATNGVFTWTPTEAQGPGIYDITVRVTDNSLPPLSDAKTFRVTVNEVNEAPVLAAITNRSVHAGALVTFTNSAMDADLPANTLSYSLETGAPPGAGVGAATGVFVWQTGDIHAGTTNLITVRVTDNGVPPKADVQSFAIQVVARPAVQNSVISGDDFVLTWSAIPGTKYRVQFKNDMNDPTWSDLVPDVTADDATASIHDTVGSSQRFYRVLVVGQ